MKTSTLVRASLLCAVLALVACGNNNNNNTDAGTGGGTGGSTGGGAGGGGGASFTACSFSNPSTCAAGTSCMAYVTDPADPQNTSGIGCIPGACDVFTQDCAADGGAAQECAYVQNGNVPERACVPAGTKAEGDSCTGNECAAGLLCVRVNSAPGTCKKTCRGNSDCASGSSCNLPVGFANSVEVVTVCGPVCDVLTQNCASSTDGCYLGPTGTLCVPQGTKTTGQPCTNGNDCVKGDICLTVTPGDGGTASQQCVQFCQFPSGTPACSGGTQCAQLRASSSSPPVADGGVGGCI